MVSRRTTRGSVRFAFVTALVVAAVATGCSQSDSGSSTSDSAATNVDEVVEADTTVASEVGTSTTLAASTTTTTTSSPEPVGDPVALEAAFAAAAAEVSSRYPDFEPGSLQMPELTTADPAAAVVNALEFLWSTYERYPSPAWSDLVTVEGSPASVSESKMLMDLIDNQAVLAFEEDVEQFRLQDIAVIDRRDAAMLMGHLDFAAIPADATLVTMGFSPGVHEIVERDSGTRINAVPPIGYRLTVAAVPSERGWVMALASRVSSDTVNIDPARTLGFANEFAAESYPDAAGEPIALPGIDVEEPTEALQEIVTFSVAYLERSPERAYAEVVTMPGSQAEQYYQGRADDLAFSGTHYEFDEHPAFRLSEFEVTSIEDAENMLPESSWRAARAGSVVVRFAEDFSAGRIVEFGTGAVVQSFDGGTGRGTAVLTPTPHGWLIAYLEYD